MSSIQQRIKMACIKSSISLTDLASQFGANPSPFSIRLKNGKFTKQELTEMAQILGCQYRSFFKFADAFVAEEPDIGGQIKIALNHGKMSITALADKFGVQQQAMSKKMSIGKFTQDDLYTVAKHIGCEYISEFRYDDGTVI